MRYAASVQSHTTRAGAPALPCRTESPPGYSLVRASTLQQVYSQGYRSGRKSATIAVMRWGQFKLVSAKEVFGCEKSRDMMCFLATS